MDITTPSAEGMDLWVEDSFTARMDAMRRRLAFAEAYVRSGDKERARLELTDLRDILAVTLIQVDQGSIFAVGAK